MPMPRLRSQFSPPALLSGGHLRPLSRAMPNTLIKHYPESYNAGGTTGVLTAM